MAEMPTSRLPRLHRTSVMTFIIAILWAGLILTAFNSARADVIIQNDMGGSMGEYIRTIAAIRDRGERVIIDGDCYSACTLYTAMIPRNRICVTPRAALGFHLAQAQDDRGRIKTSMAGTELLITMYPAKIRNWINRHGGLGRSMLILRGPDLNAIYQSCR